MLTISNYSNNSRLTLGKSLLHFSGEGAYPEPQNSKTLNVKCKSQPGVDQSAGLLLLCGFKFFGFAVYEKNRPHRKGRVPIQSPCLRYFLNKIRYLNIRICFKLIGIGLTDLKLVMSSARFDQCNQIFGIGLSFQIDQSQMTLIVNTHNVSHPFL